MYSLQFAFIDDDKTQLICNLPQSPKEAIPSEKANANKILQENIEQLETIEARQDEWRKAALVLNNLFMWIYILAVIISDISIFLRSPVV